MKRFEIIKVESVNLQTMNVGTTWLDVKDPIRRRKVLV